MNQLNLPHETNNNKTVEKQKLKMKKNGYAQKYRSTVRGVSPEEEKEGYGGKDLWRRKVLSLE